MRRNGGFPPACSACTLHSRFLAGIPQPAASRDDAPPKFLPLPLQTSVKEVTPTVGFNVEQFARSAINFTVFDMSGAGKYRNLWEHYYKDAQAIIFVIDCSDKLRMCVVKEELQAMLQHPDTRGVPTLFFANKIDISDHLNPVECVQYLDLDSVKDRPWHITPSNALTGSDPLPSRFSLVLLLRPLVGLLYSTSESQRRGGRRGEEWASFGAEMGRRRGRGGRWEDVDTYGQWE